MTLFKTGCGSLNKVLAVSASIRKFWLWNRDLWGEVKGCFVLLLPTSFMTESYETGFPWEKKKVSVFKFSFLPFLLLIIENYCSLFT